MSFSKKTTVLALASSLYLFGAGAYIVPKDYDNTYLSNKSVALSVIHNGLGTLSATSFPIGGKNRRFRCDVIPMIQCKPTPSPFSPPAISVEAVEVSLKSTAQKTVPQYSVLTEAEAVGSTQWRVCAAAIGGEEWDTVDLSVSKDNATGKITHDLTYTPLNKNRFFWFMTNDPNPGHISSYIVVKSRQVCQ